MRKHRNRNMKNRGGVRNGAGNEARTRDLHLGKVALYQLSYSRISRKKWRPIGGSNPCYRRERAVS